MPSAIGRARRPPYKHNHGLSHSLYLYLYLLFLFCAQIMCGSAPNDLNRLLCAAHTRPSCQTDFWSSSSGMFYTRSESSFRSVSYPYIPHRLCFSSTISRSVRLLWFLFIVKTGLCNLSVVSSLKSASPGAARTQNSLLISFEIWSPRLSKTFNISL